MKTAIVIAALIAASPAFAAPKQVERFCRENPEAGFVPVAYTGERDLTDWMCVHGKAVTQTYYCSKIAQCE